MFDNELKSWLLERGYLSPNEHVKRYTHLSMDGGKLYIPRHDIFNFLQKYVEGIEKGERYFLCESPIFNGDTLRKFYCDFDFKCEKEVTLKTFKRIVEKCSNTIYEYFGINTKISIASTETKELEEEGLIKSGYHIICPDLILTEDMSIELCRKINDRLKNEIKGYDWDTILDKNVYKSSLRMIGSLKVVRDKQTKRKLVENRSYKYIMEIPSSEEEDQNQCIDLYSCMLKTCIQNIDNSALVHPIKELGEYKKPSEITDLVQRQDVITKEVQEYINKFIPEQWHGDLLKVNKEKSHYFVHTKNRYCANIKGEHNSNGIYFQIYATGFIQRCYCRCKTLEGRSDGLCENFKSKRYKLSLRLFKILFPDKIQKDRDKLKLERNKNIFLPNRKLSYDTKRDYLKMSLNTLKYIEKKC